MYVYYCVYYTHTAVCRTVAVGKCMYEVRQQNEEMKYRRYR